MDYIIARRGTAIMAAAAVTSVSGKNGHLPAGICTVPEHRGVGVERYLLYLALLWLREMGVSEARGYAEAHSSADRLIYPCFGGHRLGVSYSRKRLERGRCAPPTASGASDYRATYRGAPTEHRPNHALERMGGSAPSGPHMRSPDDSGVE